MAHQEAESCMVGVMDVGHCGGQKVFIYEEVGAAQKVGGQTPGPPPIPALYIISQ